MIHAFDNHYQKTDLPLWRKRNSFFSSKVCLSNEIEFNDAPWVIWSSHKSHLLQVWIDLVTYTVYSKVYSVNSPEFAKFGARFIKVLGTETFHRKNLQNITTRSKFRIYFYIFSWILCKSSSIDGHDNIYPEYKENEVINEPDRYQKVRNKVFLRFSQTTQVSN